MLGSCKNPVDVLVAKDSSSPSTSGWIGVHNIYLVMAALDSLAEVATSIGPIEVLCCIRPTGPAAMAY